MWNFMLTPDGKWGAKKSHLKKKFLKGLERQNLWNQTILELYTDDNKSKYFSNSKGIFKSANTIYKKLYTMETASKAATTEFLRKISNWKKISNEQFILSETKTSLEIIKFVNSQTNNKSPGNDHLTAEFYKHFFNEVAPALLDVYDSWKKLECYF